MKDWNVILREDNEKTNELMIEYQKLKKEYNELKKLPYTREKQEQIVKLLNNIKTKLNVVKQLDDKQKKLVKYYSSYHSVNFFT